MVFRVRGIGVNGRFILSLPMLFFMIWFPVYAGSFQNAPDDFPHFVVPRQQEPFNSLREMFWLHYPRCGPQPTLWDEWMVFPALWPAFQVETGEHPFCEKWKQCLENRSIDDGGYVSSHQHASIAHPKGWPFPAWIHGQGGMGWHFSFHNTAPPPFRHDRISTCTQCTLDGILDNGLDNTGWNIIL